MNTIHTTSQRDKPATDDAIRRRPIVSTQPIQQATTDSISTAGRRPAPTLRRLDIATLAGRCALENERFQRGQPSDPRYAYEIFRRALAERDDVAWEYLYQQYRGLVERWVRNNAAFSGCSESPEDLAGEAFARFWRAIPPERFEKFPTAAALLHYLQMCASCVVIDGARARTAARLVSSELLETEGGLHTSPDEEVIGQMEREEFWRSIAARLNGEAERAVVFDSFIEGLKPREIYDARRDLFASVNDVYLAKRNVLDRLGRDQRLRGLAEPE
jgi:DNA-directed RNA polymerase specialized sigma24 family protein